MISREAVEASPEKIMTVRNYPVPKSVKDGRSFLGFASYYRRMIHSFAENAKLN